MTRGVLAPTDEMNRHRPAQPARYQFSLVETALPFARPVQRNRNNQIAREGLAVQTLSQTVSQRPGQRYAVGILQMVNDLAKGLVKQEGGPGKIEGMLARHAQAAQAFNCRRGLAALRTERRIQLNETGPTVRTCPSPATLLNRSVTMNACDWEEDVENVVEQSAFGETQRAEAV